MRIGTLTSGYTLHEALEPWEVGDLLLHCLLDEAFKQLAKEEQTHFVFWTQGEREDHAIVFFDKETRRLTFEVRYVITDEDLQKKDILRRMHRNLNGLKEWYEASFEWEARKWGDS